MDTHYKVDDNNIMDTVNRAHAAADYVLRLSDGHHLLFFAEAEDILLELWGGSTKHPTATRRFSNFIKDYWDNGFGIYNIARWLIADGATLVGTPELFEISNFAQTLYRGEDETGFSQSVIEKARAKK